MLYVFALVCMMFQAFIMEVSGETALLFRLWLLPIIALAFRTNQIRLVPIVVIGLLTDGLMATPTGLHVLEILLVYGVLMAASKHLGDQTVLSRTLIACLVTVTDTAALGFIQLILPYEVSSSYLYAHFFSFLLVQLGLCLTVLPLLSWVYRDHRRSDVRFRNRGDNA